MKESKQLPSSGPMTVANAKFESEKESKRTGTVNPGELPVWKAILSHRWGFPLVVLIVSLAVMLAISLSLKFPWDAATVALAGSLAVLVISLRSLWTMVETLSISPKQIKLNLGASAQRRWSSRAAIREEKNRVLRALKELDFDYSMGKLAESDYLTIRDRYRLRAVQAIRALEQDDALHPDLQRWLDDADADGEGLKSTRTLRCSACSANNDSDAKFCKACGTKISA